jgi:spore maturation protein B
VFEYILILILLSGLGFQAWRKKIGLYQPACAGFRMGLGICKRVLPIVLGYVTAFTCFRAVGGFDWLLTGLHPLLAHVGIPDGILPVLMARPFSGSLAGGLLAEMGQSHTPTLLMMQTAVMLGSTETTLYIITVYFGYVGVRKSRYAIPLGLCIDFMGCWLAVWVCIWFFT